MSMVERVARATGPCNAGEPGVRACEHGTQCMCLRDARLAIEAMREPTAAMVLASAFAGPERHEPDGTAAAVWQSMIDEALNDGADQDRGFNSVPGR
jgi:hypothetical protein